MIIKIRAWLASFAVLLCCHGPAHAMPDAILGQIHKLHQLQGDEGLRAAARGLGITLREDKGSVLVPVIIDRDLQRTPGFAARLQQAGSRLDAVSRSFTRILVPAGKLEQFAVVFQGERFRAPIPYKPSFGMGAKISESVALTGADGYQAGNLTGDGVKVAVIDLGFIGLSARIQEGEITSCNTSFNSSAAQTVTKHGTGVAEHVIDMAPGVEMHCLIVSDEVDLQNATDYLATNGIDIANHSVAWLAIESYYDDTGPVNTIVNESHDNDGVFWTVSAGNEARYHWRGSWMDADGDNWLEFGNGSELLKLRDGSPDITVYLNWNEYGENRKVDLNLYLVDKNGATVASSTYSQQFADPIEAILSHPSDPAEQPYSLKIRRANNRSTASLDMTLFSWNHQFVEPVVSSSQMDPANAHGAFSVGAVNRSSWLSANPSIRSYSSQGPTTDGRRKPELVAPDGTSSVSYSTASGTSFSAPTVAGAAALLLQEDSSRSVQDLKMLLQNNAIDAGVAGPDNVFGHGKLQLPLIDSDSDGLSNVEEIALGTEALDEDTDDDGLTDYEENRNSGTDPLLADTDGDGVDDYTEVVLLGTDPLVSNTADLAPRGSPDDAVNVADYLILVQLVSGAVEPTASEIALGDLNNNGELDAGDLVLMSRIVLGEIPVP
jgi:subtilisin family serine protease